MCHMRPLGIPEFREMWEECFLGSRSVSYAARRVGAQFEEFHAIEEIEELRSFEGAHRVGRDRLGGSEIEEIDANEEIKETFRMNWMGRGVGQNSKNSTQLKKLKNC